MPKITPSLWFDKGMKDIIDYYKSIFPDAKTNFVGELSDTPSGTVETATLEIFGQKFNLMTAGPLFKFNEAVSFAIDCDGQEEVDYYWDKLSKDGQESQCGWLKDKYGLSWQIVPKQLGELLGNPDREKAGKAMQAMLKMKKIVIADLEK
ncbi:MAG: VOC family protein [Candidatus Pacebacteria bacterium]|nr:VOC family protein [Candidatus Paceibacterota bacterium]